MAGPEYAMRFRLVWLWLHSSCAQRSAYPYSMSMRPCIFSQPWLNQEGETMMKNLSAPLGKRMIAGALAGVVGGAAHAAVNEIDRRVLHHNADDLVMLGGVFTDDVAKARKIGIGMHLTFAAMFGATYAVLLHPRDADDALRKGMAFALTEHFTLFPLGILVDNHHPHAAMGTLGRVFHPTSLVEATLRHLALGYGIGKAYPRMMAAIRP